MTGLLIALFCFFAAAATSWVIVHFSPWIRGPIAIALPIALGVFVTVVAYRFGDQPEACGAGGDKSCIIPFLASFFAAAAVALIYGAVTFFGSVGGGAWAWLAYRKRLFVRSNAPD